MTAALTPALALDYLHALSADLRAAVVLDAGGECLAGPPALGEAARAVLVDYPRGERGESGRAQSAPGAVGESGAARARRVGPARPCSKGSRRPAPCSPRVTIGTRSWP